MQIILQPYHILLAALVGWANERQQRIIEFQNDQIEALLKLLGTKRLLLTDVQGLEKLTQLKSLNLGANQLTDVQGLEKLTQLEELSLESNKLTNLRGLENLT